MDICTQCKEEFNENCPACIEKLDDYSGRFIAMLKTLKPILKKRKEMKKKG